MIMVVNNSEYSAKQYYFYQYYANSYYRVYMSLEDWLASKIFRNDPSRVFLASPEYAFRRRFELIDSNHTEYDKVKASSLQFPFASYWPLNSGWQPDDRVATNTAAQVYVGMYMGNTLVKSASVILNVPVQLYFDREDDARLAYEKIFFDTFNPHYYSTTVAYGPNTIGIPIEITIKNLQFNPSFKETDWLKQNRIFIITADFEIRTCIIRSPNQPDFNVSVGNDGYLVDDNGNVVVDEEGRPVLYDSGIANYYIVNNVLLHFNSDGWTYKSFKCNTDDSDDVSGFPETGEVGVIYINDFNRNVDKKYHYLYDSNSKNFYESDIDDYDERFKFISFDSSVSWPENPSSKVTITTDDSEESYIPVYVDTYREDRANYAYINRNQFIWNPYTEKYERYDSRKLNPDSINIYGQITINTTKIVFLPTTVSGTEATVNWTYISQSHDISYIRVRRQNASEWSSINSGATSYEISNLTQDSEYTYEFEFGFEGDSSSETNTIVKSTTFTTTNNSDTNYEDNSSLIGVKW